MENATASCSKLIPLPKGSACLPCRKKKLRCDAKRPVCSGCQRSHASNRGAGNGKPPCSWDDSDHHSTSTTQRKWTDGGKESAREEGGGGEQRGGGKKKVKRGEEGRRRDDGGFQKADAESEKVPSIQSSTSNLNPHRTTPFQTNLSIFNPSPPLPFISSLLSSSYPPTLPPPPLLHHLIQTFFTKIPTIPKMLNQPLFLTSLTTLPPSHPSFPHEAILHAMVALAVRHCGNEELKGEVKTRPPERDPLGAGKDGFNIFEGEEESFRGRHARLAKEGMDGIVRKGERLFDGVVAAVILEAFDYQEARWVQSWIHSAFSVRLAIPLGLHQGTNASYSWDQFATEPILPRTEDPYELELRRRTFWLGLLSERRASIASKWPHSLADEDVTVGLPTRLDQFKRGPGSNIQLNPQTLASTDLFTYNPPEHTDSFVLNLKSIILLRRTQLLSETLQESYLALGVDPRSTNSFQEAQRQIEKYIRDAFSWGGLSLRDSMGGKIDGDLMLASTLPHVALIYLHEDYASVLSKGDRSATVLLQAARAILGTVVTLCSTSYEFGSLPPFLSFCWFIGGRTLTRFYQGLLFISDFVAAEKARNEIRIFEIGLARFAVNCPLAEKEVGMLEKAIQAASSFPPVGPPGPCMAGFKPIVPIQPNPNLNPNPTPSPSDSSAHSTSSASDSASPQNITTTAFSPSNYFDSSSSSSGMEKGGGETQMLGESSSGGGTLEEWFGEFGNGDLEVLLGTSFVGVSS